MKLQLLGSEAYLEKGPGEMGQERGGHNMTKELLGSEASINQTPYNLFPINENTGKPLRQFLGSEAELDRTPRHGWQSYPSPLPTSIRTEKQSR